MPRNHARYPFIVCLALLLWLTHVAPIVALAQEASPDARAVEIEQQMTDDERFSLIVSVIGPVPNAIKFKPKGPCRLRLAILPLQRVVFPYDLLYEE